MSAADKPQPMPAGPLMQASSALPGLQAHGKLARSVAPLLVWWRTLVPRERRLLGLAGMVVALGLLWALAIAPAWRTLQRTPAELERLDLQRQQMQSLAAEANELRATPAVALAQTQAALRGATERLGSAGSLSVQGDRAVLTLVAVEPPALREWLAEVRSGARARPLEARLSRAGAGLSGTLVLQLPAVGGGPGGSTGAGPAGSPGGRAVGSSGGLR